MDISSLRERALPEAFSVSGLNEYIKKLFDSDQIGRASCRERVCLSV